MAVLTDLEGSLVKNMEFSSEEEDRFLAVYDEYDEHCCGFPKTVPTPRIILMFCLLREVGYEWEATTMYNAVKSGHLRLVKWLKQVGCFWIRYAIHEAEKLGHTKMVECLSTTE